MDSHEIFSQIIAPTTRCDVCEKTKQRLLRRCQKCGWKICLPCYEARNKDTTHDTTRDFWTKPTPATAPTAAPTRRVASMSHLLTVVNFAKEVFDAENADLSTAIKVPMDLPLVPAFDESTLPKLPEIAYFPRNTSSDGKKVSSKGHQDNQAEPLGFVCDWCRREEMQNTAWLAYCNQFYKDNKRLADLKTQHGQHVRFAQDERLQHQLVGHHTSTLNALATPGDRASTMSRQSSSGLSSARELDEAIYGEFSAFARTEANRPNPYSTGATLGQGPATLNRSSTLNISRRAGTFAPAPANNSSYNMMGHPLPVSVARAQQQRQQNQQPKPSPRRNEVARLKITSERLAFLQRARADEGRIKPAELAAFAQANQELLAECKTPEEIMVWMQTAYVQPPVDMAEHTAHILRHKMASGEGQTDAGGLGQGQGQGQGQGR